VRVSAMGGDRMIVGTPKTPSVIAGDETKGT
jgi:hypothetical protein